MICLLVCVTACAHPSEPARASSQAVDPLVDVVSIPPGACLGLDDHFALSTAALVQMLKNQRDEKTRNQLLIASCESNFEVASAQRDEAIRAAESSGWWQRWAIPIAAAGTFLGAGLGLITGYTVGRK